MSLANISSAAPAEIKTSELIMSDSGIATRKKIAGTARSLKCCINTETTSEFKTLEEWQYKAIRESTDPTTNELFFWNANDDIKYSIEYQISNESLTFSEPEPMFGPGFQNDAQGPWDYSPIRDKFLIIAQPETSEALLTETTELSFVSNWLSEVIRLWAPNWHELQPLHESKSFFMCTL